MPDSVAPAASGKGVFSRAIGIVFSPGETYRDALRDPRPAGILFVCCVVIALAAGLPQLTERGRQASLDAQVEAMERFSGRPVTPEIHAQLEQQAQFGVYASFVGVFMFLPVFSIIAAGVLWAVFNVVLGGASAFKSVLTVVTHSQVIGALGALVSAPIQWLQGTQTMTGPFNLGALVPMLDPGSFLSLFLSGLGVFVLWQIAVCGIGLAVLYSRRTGPIAVGLITAYLMLAAIVTGLISSYTGGH